MKNYFLFIVLFFGAFVTAQNLKVPQLTEILNTQLASNDVTIVSDISAGASKKLAIGELDKRFSFSVTAPITKSGSENYVLALPQATTSADGYLSSGDWTLFNAKQATVSASAPVLFSANNISLPKATASADGYLASGDFSTFNAKVSLTGTEALTNKDYDGGTASNTSRITIPKAAKTTLDALTRKQGTIVFDTTSNKPYYDDGSLLKVVGSGSGGAKNFISDGDAEAGTTGWATFDDGAVAVPVDGTGGSPAVVTWTTTSTVPLENLNSFTYVKTGSDAQGEGVAYTFSVDPAWRSKVINVSFDYILNSGTFVAGTSSASSDVTVWLYDVTNSTVIQPSSFKLLSNSTSTADKFQSTFQTSASGASYRLIFMSTSASASAYTLKIDNVQVSPSEYSFGTPITDWVLDSSITVTASSGSNPTYSASNAWRRRVGDSIEIKYHVVVTAGGSLGVGLLLNMPTGHTIDPNKSAALGGTGSQGQFGGGSWYDDSSAAKNFTVTHYYSSSTQLGILNNDGAASLLSNTLAAADRLAGFVTVPISGFSSSVQTSDQTSTRIVAARYRISSNKTTSGVIDYDTKIIDTHNAVTTGASWRFTAPVPGIYSIGATSIVAVAVSDTLAVWKNGASNVGIQTLNSTATQNGHALIELKAGDYVDLRSNGATSATFDSGSSGLVNQIFIERVSGPNQIAASETVAFRGKNTAGTSVANTGTTIIPFATEDYDTHGAFATNTFTVPITGKYRVSTTLYFASSTYAAGNITSAIVYKNGAIYAYGDIKPAWAAATANTGASIVTVVDCIAGDTIDIRALNNRTAGATLLDTTAGVNHLTIERIGF